MHASTLGRSLLSAGILALTMLPAGQARGSGFNVGPHFTTVMHPMSTTGKAGGTALAPGTTSPGTGTTGGSGSKSTVTSIVNGNGTTTTITTNSSGTTTSTAPTVQVVTTGTGLTASTGSLFGTGTPVSGGGAFGNAIYPGLLSGSTGSGFFGGSGGGGFFGGFTGGGVASSGFLPSPLGQQSIGPMQVVMPNSPFADVEAIGTKQVFTSGLPSTVASPMVVDYGWPESVGKKKHRHGLARLISRKH